MTTLAKASKQYSHKKAFDTHCVKDIWCLIIQNKIEITPLLTQHKTTFCPHSLFMCFVWICGQAAIISLESIKWLDVSARSYKLLKVIFSLVISVNSPACLSTQNSSAHTGRNFMKFDFKIFWTVCREK